MISSAFDMRESASTKRRAPYNVGRRFSIEHNVRAVMALSAEVVVLNYGTVIARGAPAAVAADAAVITAYLGERRATRRSERA